MIQQSKVICSINGLRNALARSLIVPLNSLWLDAALGRGAVEWVRIDQLIKHIRDQAQKILIICQNQSKSVTLKQLKNKKRHGEYSEPQHSIKMLKIEEETIET